MPLSWKRANHRGARSNFSSNAADARSPPLTFRFNFSRVRMSSVSSAYCQPKRASSTIHSFFLLSHIIIFPVGMIRFIESKSNTAICHEFYSLFNYITFQFWNKRENEEEVKAGRYSGACPLEGLVELSISLTNVPVPLS